MAEPMVRLAQTVHLSSTDTNTISPNGLKQDSTRPMSPRSSIGCAQTYFHAYGTFDAKRATILHRCQHCLQTDQNEILHDPRHLGVPSGASKMISEPMVCLAQTVHLSCTDTSTVSKQKEVRFHITQSPRSSIGCIQNDFQPMVRSTQTVHLSCVKISTISKCTEMSFHLSHLT